MAAPLMQDNVWLQRPRYEEAEAYYYAVQAGTAAPGQNPGGSSQAQGGRTVKNEITQAREQIANALKQPLILNNRTVKGKQGGGGGNNPQVHKRLDDLEKENKDLRKTIKDLQELIGKLEKRVTAVEKGGKGDAPAAPKASPAPAASAKKDNDDDDDDDDFELFGDDDDEEEAEKEREARKKAALEQYAAKKGKKPAVVAKSSVILDVKPWDDETDMVEMERLVRTIEKDGLVWGVAKLVDLAYGIKKLTIICVVEDEKVGVEDLKEEIEEFEDHVQSVDIAAFNKI